MADRFNKSGRQRYRNGRGFSYGNPDIRHGPSLPFRQVDANGLDIGVTFGTALAAIWPLAEQNGLLSSPRLPTVKVNAASAVLTVPHENGSQYQTFTVFRPHKRPCPLSVTIPYNAIGI